MARVWGIETRDFDTADGFTYRAHLHGEDTSYGFRHVCSADWDDGHDSICCYYNRTWESYRYQSVLHKSISAAISREQDFLRREWMDSHGYARMTAKRRADFDANPPTSDLLRRLQDIAAQV